MKKVFVLIIGALLSFFVGQSAFAQNSKKPKWAEGYFEEGPHTYLQCFEASGYDRDDARAKAVKKIYESRNIAAGTDVSLSIKDNEVQVGGKKDLIVKARIIDEYHEVVSPGNHKVYLLVQTAKNPTYDYDPVSEKYSFSPRVFVPGWAQINKGSTGKGICFIASEVVFVGGAFFANSMRKNYLNKINSTHNATLVNSYINKANTWTTIRNVSIVGACAVYLWNVIDGIAAKGEKHLLLGDSRVNISPYSDFQSMGLALNINF
ncbi:MAG: hypothetical protein K6F96_08785 [Bacteroidales bacterium]|nr:hypothetical protein [Bacteroidales bacterium]